MKKTMIEKQWDLNSSDLKKWLCEDYIEQFLSDIESTNRTTNDKSDREFSCEDVSFIPDVDTVKGLLEQYKDEGCELECRELSFSPTYDNTYKLSIALQTLSDGERWGDVECELFAIDIDYKISPSYFSEFSS